jgi:hypothetical protein
MEGSENEGHFLIRFTLVVRTHLDRHLSTKSPQEVKQLVCCEAAEMSVHQVRYIGLRNSQNPSDFALFQLFLFQDFEDVKSYLRSSHELIRVFQAEVREDIPGANLDPS